MKSSTDFGNGNFLLNILNIVTAGNVGELCKIYFLFVFRIVKNDKDALSIDIDGCELISFLIPIEHPYYIYYKYKMNYFYNRKYNMIHI